MNLLFNDNINNGLEGNSSKLLQITDYMFTFNNSEIKEFINNKEALSISKLKKYDFKKPSTFDSSSINAIKGTLIDDMICNPNSIADKYYICDLDFTQNQYTKSLDAYFFKVISNAQSKNISLDIVLGKLKQLDFNKVKSSVLSIYRNISNSRNLDATVLDKIEANKEYFYHRINSYGKTLINQSIYNELYQTLNIAKTSKISEELTFSDDKIYLTQVPIVEKIQIADVEILAKGLFDLIIIDFNEKSVYFTDYKFTESTFYDFGQIFNKLRYDYQLVWYNELLKSSITNSLRNIVLEEFSLDISNYKILNDQLFLTVISSSLPNYSFYYTINKDQINDAIYGKFWKTGLKDLIFKYQLAKEKNLQSEYLDYFINDGIINHK